MLGHRYHDEHPLVGATTTRTENGARQFCRGALERGIHTHTITTYTTLHLDNDTRRYHFCDEHPLVQKSTCKRCGASFELHEDERAAAVEWLGADAVEYCNEGCWAEATIEAIGEPTREDPRLTAIRLDSEVGTGSCSHIDETYTDEELAEELDKGGITTPEDAVRWAREAEATFLDCD